MQQPRQQRQKGFPARACRATAAGMHAAGQRRRPADRAVPGLRRGARVVAVGHDADAHQRAGRFAEGALEVGADVALVVQPLVQLARHRTRPPACGCGRCAGWRITVPGARLLHHTYISVAYGISSPVRVRASSDSIASRGENRERSPSKARTMRTGESSASRSARSACGDQFGHLPGEADAGRGRRARCAPCWRSMLADDAASDRHRVAAVLARVAESGGRLAGQACSAASRRRRTAGAAGPHGASAGAGAACSAHAASTTAAASAPQAPADSSSHAQRPMLAGYCKPAIAHRTLHKKSRPKAAFQVSCFLAGTRPAVEIRSCDGYRSRSRWTMPLAPVDRAVQGRGGAAAVAHASVRGVHGGALGQVVHVADGDLAGTRVGSRRPRRCGTASRPGGFRRRRSGPGHRSASRGRQTAPIVGHG